MEKIYKVPQDNLEVLVGKLDKLSKKAKKCSMPPFELEIVKQFQKEDMTANGVPTYTPYVMFTLTAAQPKLNGWSFLATINHTDDGNIVRSMPGTEPDPAWQIAKPNCDHCSINRKRNNSYIVQNEKGVVKQVGSSCLSDFIGHKNPHEMAKYAEYLVAATEACAVEHSNAEHASAKLAGVGGSRHFDPKIHPYLDLRTYLAKTFQVIREEGWISKREAFETGKNATADRALFRMFEDTAPAPLPDYEAATQAVEWVENLQPSGDYEANIVAVAGNGSGAFMHQQIGLVASLAFVYPQVVAKLVRSTLLEQSGVSPYLGEPDAQVEFTGTVVMRRHFQGRYGPGVVLKFQDGQGRIATVFTKPKDLSAVEAKLPKPVGQGTVLVVRAVVQGHEEFRGEKQTKLRNVELSPQNTNGNTHPAIATTA